MFYIYFDGRGNAKVFDTDDFSLETLTESDTRAFIKSTGARAEAVNADFEVLCEGSYALLYMVVPVGNKYKFAAKLIQAGVTNTAGINEQLSGIIHPSLSTFPLGCKITLLARVNGIRYGCYRKFNDSMQLIDKSAWQRYTGK